MQRRRRNPSRSRGAWHHESVVTSAHETPNPSRVLAETRWLRALAGRLLTAEADDVAQDAWLAAQRGVPAASRSAWLAGIVRHLASRRRREAIGRRYHESRAALPEASVPAAADEVARAQTQRRLLDAVLALPEPYRSTVILRFLDGLSPRAIAARQGLAAAAVRQRVARGLAMLRARMNADTGSPDAAERALLVLTLPTPSVVAIGATTATLTMTTKLALPLLAAAAAILAWLGFARRGSDAPAIDPAPAPAATVSVSSPHAGAPERTDQPTTVPIRTLAPERRGVLAGADRERDLHGIVVDADGVPVAGAQLRVRHDPTCGFAIPDLAYGATRQDVATAVSDAAGEFAVPLRPGVGFELHVRADGFAPSLLLTRYAGERVTVILTRAASLVGVVVDAVGAPVAKARIRVARHDDVSSTDLAGGATDDAGRFRIDGLPAGNVRVRAIPLDLPPPWWSELHLEPGTTTEITIDVSPGITLRGRVVDATTSDPIGGAEIGLGWTFCRTVVTDPHGAYEMRGFAAEGYEVCVRAPGFGRGRKMLGAAADGVVVVDFALRRGRRLLGRVIDERGLPCAGVYVAATATVILNGVGDTDWRAGHTSGSGRFELVDLSPDRDHTLLLKAPGFATVAYDLPARARSETPFDVGTLVLPPAASLRGVLVDQRGQPIADGLVEVLGVNADHGRYAEGSKTDAAALHIGERTARTDDLGRFTFADLAAATYTVKPRRRGEPTQAGLPVTLAAGEDRRDFTLTLATTHSIAGRVVDDDGNGVAHVFVHCTDGATITDADGAFVVRGLAPGPYDLQAVLTGSTSGERALLPVPPTPVEAGATDVTLVMHRAATVRGTILDAAGLPVPNARVWCEDAGGAFVTSGKTDADGGFVLAVPWDAVVDLVARPGREDETVFIHAREQNQQHGPRTRQRGVHAPADGVTLRLSGEGR